MGSPDGAWPLAVSTTEGQVLGIKTDNLRIFRAIPYAKPPVGERRFAPPEPPEARNGTLTLSQDFGNSCPQSDISLPLQSCCFLVEQGLNTMCKDSDQ